MDQIPSCLEILANAISILWSWFPEVKCQNRKQGIQCHHHSCDTINSLRPSDTSMHEWSRPSLLQILACHLGFVNYRQVSNIRRTLVGNKIVDHSDVVGASPVGAAPTTSSYLDLTAGFIGLGNDNCKTIGETYKFGDLVWLILESLR